ncbi:ABC transporter permease [Paenibacillus sp. YPG26]|uniref:ABC transporter permease n=1 Tax=Paenibacillus sp. YPG26 TaxID=2878915 RepID=UPI00203DC832|nr:ABC transporter permease [Paenibacillus sp. YPG26]USB33637.1 ABC transporter permease [Paenibacillus sp. YPG26]
MNNYLRSELYRIKSKKLIYLLPFLLAAIPLLGIFLVWSVGRSDPSFTYNSTGFLYRFCRISFNNLVLLLPFLTIYLFASEYSSGTFKNVVASGISRRHIYLSKITVIFCILVLLSVIDIAMIVSAIELLLNHKDLGEKTLFYQNIIQTMPLFIAAYSISIMLCFTEEKIVSNLVKYFLIIYIIPVFLGNFENIIPGLKSLLHIFPVIRLSEGLPFTMENLLFNWLEALVYFVAAFVIGLSIFNKKEI